MVVAKEISGDAAVVAVLCVFYVHIKTITEK